MSSPFRFRPLRADEAADAARRAQVAFGAADDPDALVERLRGRIAEGALWGLADAATDAVLGQAVLVASDHWLGGRRVACQHVGAVGVAPEHRGAGVASALMREAIRRGAADRLGLSLLFPATTALYRNHGWEHSGTFTRWRVASRLVPAMGPTMRPLEGEWEAVAACQTRWAASLSGPEVRGARRWEQLRDRVQFAYGLDAVDGEGLDAYALVRHERIPDHWQHTLDLVDWAALNPRGLQAVVGFVGRHGTVARDALFRAPALNPWALLLPEQDLERCSDFDWMARPLDVAAAVAARGFPAGVAVSVTMALDDPVVEANAGPWRLEVVDGRGTLETAPAADVRMDVTAVGPLFTGYRPARELARAGRLVGPDESIRALEAAFAGPLPLLLDFF